MTKAWQAATVAVAGACDRPQRLSLVTSLGATTAMQTAVAQLTGQISLATAVQWAWNAACATLGGPAGVIVIVVAALAAGLGILIACQKDEDNQLKETTGKIHAQRDAWLELKSSSDANMEAAAAEIGHIQDLWQELQTLVDEVGRVIGSKERVKAITEEISNVAPDSSKWVDEERIAYKDGAAAVQEMIAVKKAEAVLDAMAPAYKEVIVNWKKV